MQTMRKAYSVYIHLHPVGDERTGIDRDGGDHSVIGGAYEFCRRYRAPKGEAVDSFTIHNVATGHRHRVTYDDL